MKQVILEQAETLQFLDDKLSEQIERALTLHRGGAAKGSVG